MRIPPPKKFLKIIYCARKANESLTGPVGRQERKRYLSGGVVVGGRHFAGLWLVVLSLLVPPINYLSWWTKPTATATETHTEKSQARQPAK